MGLVHTQIFTEGRLRSVKHTHTCSHTHTHVHTHMFTHTCSHTHTHTHTQISTHTHVQKEEELKPSAARPVFDRDPEPVEWHIAKPNEINEYSILTVSSSSVGVDKIILLSTDVLIAESIHITVCPLRYVRVQYL